MNEEDVTEFDIVISVGPNDIDFVSTVIKHARKNILHHRNIYLILATNGTKIENPIEGNIYIIDETVFPFNVAQFLGKNARNGWYFQQLIKLYAWKYIKDLSEYYLVLDADTLFLKPTEFFKFGKPLYNTTPRQNHIPYFTHMQKLHPSFTKQDPNLSAVTNHMIFHRKILKKIFQMVEKHHASGGDSRRRKRFWELFLEFVEKDHILHAGASEYELYFNFIYLYLKDTFLLRELRYAETGRIPYSAENVLDYITCHHYMREQERKRAAALERQNIK